MERQQRIAVVPGSFDPITKGHMDIIRRAKPLFDKVIVLVEYEFQQALINKELYSGVETVFLTTSAVNQYLSSSVVKQIASLGGDIHPFVPEQVHDRIVRRLRQDEEQENQQ